MRVARYGLCIGVFLLGWLSGSFFVITILSHSSPIFRGSVSNPSSFDIFSQLNTSWFRTTSPPISTSISSAPLFLHALPPIPSNTSQRFLYLDFPVDDRLFSNINYLALEVSLTSFAHLRVLLPAPKTSTKLPGMLSTQHFTKYRKSGFDIEVLPVGGMDQSRGPGFGNDYWATWKDQCCVACHENCKYDSVQFYYFAYNGL